MKQELIRMIVGSLMWLVAIPSYAQGTTILRNDLNVASGSPGYYVTIGYTVQQPPALARGAFYAVNPSSDGYLSAIHVPLAAGGWDAIPSTANFGGGVVWVTTWSASPLDSTAQHSTTRFSGSLFNSDALRDVRSDDDRQVYVLSLEGQSLMPIPAGTKYLEIQVAIPPDGGLAWLMPSHSKDHQDLWGIDAPSGIDSDLAGAFSYIPIPEPSMLFPALGLALALVSSARRSR